MTRLFEPPELDDVTIEAMENITADNINASVDRDIEMFRQMRELERLAQKAPCMMTKEQWNDYEAWQEKADDPSD